MDIHGTFTMLGKHECPVKGTIITDEDMHEVQDILVGNLRLSDLEPGIEFRFVADDDEVYLDDWSPTPGTGCCMSLPLYLAGEPEYDGCVVGHDPYHPEYTT